MIHTVGYVDDNDDIVIIGSFNTEKNEKLVRFTLGEEITAQLLESSTETPLSLISKLFEDINR